MKSVFLVQILLTDNEWVECFKTNSFRKAEQFIERQYRCNSVANYQIIEMKFRGRYAKMFFGDQEINAPEYGRFDTNEFYESIAVR